MKVTCNMLIVRHQTLAVGWDLESRDSKWEKEKKLKVSLRD